ncbi:RNA methyltransferase, partial [Synechococcus sp. AH-551-E05]|nr:RNA methyltransferase [Synechococcus sp. AH-551-E05]
LHPRLQACCTHAVTLPHSSRVESLNVAAAAVPLLLERRRARMAGTQQ